MVSLVVEASNGFLSIACIENNKLLSAKETQSFNNLSAIILAEIDSCLKEARIDKKNLSEIIFGTGPGSYTAIRVVAAVCKTLAYSLKIPIKVISSLKLQALLEYDSGKLIVPIIDARRGSVFAGVYEQKSDDLVAILEDGYYSLDEINDFILKQNKDTIYIGKDVVKLDELLLNSELIEKNSNNIKAQDVMKIYKHLELSDSFNAMPKYMRKTEAERELENDKSK